MSILKTLTNVLIVSLDEGAAVTVPFWRKHDMKQRVLIYSAMSAVYLSTYEDGLLDTQIRLGRIL